MSTRVSTQETEALAGVARGKNDANGMNRRAGRGISRLGRAAMLCLGLLAMLTMVLVVIVLTPVVLLATVIPAAKQNRRQEGGRYETRTWQRDSRRQEKLIEQQR